MIKLLVPLAMWVLLGTALLRLWRVEAHLLLWWSMVALLVLDFLFSRTLQQIEAGGDGRPVGSAEEQQRWLRIARRWWFYFELGAILVGVHAHRVAGLPW